MFFTQSDNCIPHLSIFLASNCYFLLNLKKPKLKKAKICIIRKRVNHYYTIPHFDPLKIYSCGKHFEKRRNCLKQAISPFLTMFSTFYDTIFHFKCTLKCCLQFVSIWTTLKFCHLVMG